MDEVDGNPATLERSRHGENNARFVSDYHRTSRHPPGLHVVGTGLSLDIRASDIRRRVRGAPLRYGCRRLLHLLHSPSP
jgi:hypothetical protein